MERKGLSTTMGRQRTVDRKHRSHTNRRLLREGGGGLTRRALTSQLTQGLGPNVSFWGNDLLKDKKTNYFPLTIFFFETTYLYTFYSMVDLNLV